ncbi:MAG: hypothetical protein O3B74_12255 [Proteobacteria bacterium]|nr:hypothetical protein [Pseudomonadota bacterium]
MSAFGPRLLIILALALLGPAVSPSGALAQDRLTEVGASITAVNVDQNRVSLSQTVALGGDVVTGTFVTAHTASGKALQRNHLGYWVPWDGQLASMADNHFPVVDDAVAFKILKDEDMSAELFPVRIMIAYRTRQSLKFGVFEIRNGGAGASQ